MTKTEIFEALDLVRNTVIQAHVALNNALDQIEKLKQQVQQDITAENHAPGVKP